MKLNEIFDVKYGVNLELINCEIAEDNSSEYINFVSRTSENNGVSARVKKIDGIEPQQAGTITVAGGGSVLSTFLQVKPYYSGRDLYVLTPKKEMTINEKLFWCAAINYNAYKYNYGRQANTTLGELELPDIIPEWVNNRKIKTPQTENINSIELISTKNWTKFKIKEIFDYFESTKGTTVDELIEGDEIPYIAAKKSLNGLEKMVSYSENQEYISKGNCIVFIQLGQGSAGYALYHENDFIGMRGKTMCGYSKNLNKYNGLFLVTLLDMERPKFSYGRSWTGDRLFETEILLPSLIQDNHIVPDWSYMERYIKSLDFGDII